MRTVRTIAGLAALVGGVLLLAGQSLAADAPGVTDKEIRIGNTAPYSGPASAYGTISRAQAAYFKMVNDHGGINGRKVNFISYDDGYSPPKTVEQVRRLVEQDEVAFVNVTGTPTNTAVWEYLNAKKVPQLGASGANKWADPKGHPWTMGWNATYLTEGSIYAHYILTQVPGAKIGILFQNDDYGKDCVKGMKAGLGAKAARMIVKELSYEVTDPTIDSQIVALKASGADVFYDVSTPKFAAQAIRKVNEIGWKPVHILNLVSSSVAAVLTPAGLDKSVGLITTAYIKDPTDPQWNDDADVKAWRKWMAEYYPEGSTADILNAQGYAMADTFRQMLAQCGNDLSRENIMRQAANLKNLNVAMLLPGVKINTAPDDFYPIEQLQLARFDGTRWVLFGELIDGRSAQ